MKIAISGKSGCGNTTICKTVAEKLGLDFINFTFRNLAVEKCLSLEEVLEKAAKDDNWDREVDRRQVELAEKSSGCVLGSRLAIWMLKTADLKVYLRAGEETRVKRIMKREGGSYSETAAFTARRDREDHDRYVKLYGIDNDDYSFADMVVDTDTLNPEQITGMIIEKIKTIGRR